MQEETAQNELILTVAVAMCLFWWWPGPVRALDIDTIRVFAALPQASCTPVDGLLTPAITAVDNLLK